ncbi:MAG: hypothetical protein KIS76_03330 [Pyrinomonadaceae bacterium]|nr:hypothetical protein [Pyrinomonadaceae bacterium]
MKNSIYRISALLALVLAIGTLPAFAGGKNDDAKKRPKNTGILTVKTTPDARTVKVDGQVLGMSGVEEAAEFWLSPGFHTLEVEGPNGKSFIKQVEIRKDTRNCVCLKIVERTETEACPYNVSVDGPDKVLEGDLITFASIDAMDYPTPLNYVWKVSPSAAKVTSGFGTSAITVDTSGLGGQTITAELDVSDGLYAKECGQRLPVSTIVESLPPIEAIKFDEFESKAFDDDKARLDSFAVQLQNSPDAQGYIIMYQGTDTNSIKNRNVDLLSKRTLDYLVNTRGIDPSRIVITKWGNRPTTTYELWLIPPGAKTPVPND